MARTVGVEEEFLLLDAVEGRLRLRAVGDPVARAADERTDGQFEHELKREQAELGTTPHERLPDLLDELRRRRAELATSAAEHGARIVAVGTAPMPATATATPDERYHRMGEIFGETARTALSCGMHVHVGVTSRDEGIRVVNGIRRWLPVLLALSANSPFHGGHDTGYESYRSRVWQQWPTAGPTGAFDGAQDYDRVRQALIDTGAALDDGMLYFDVRLSATYPTVELRVADVCVRPADAAALAGLARALVDAAADDALPGGPAVLDRAELVRAMTWRAAVDGMTGALVHPVSGRLVAAWSLVDELLELLPLGGDADLVHAALAVVRDEGTGSAVQRRTYERTGSLADVVEDLAARTCAG